MQLDFMIDELGREISRTDIDNRIKLWIQGAINWLYGVLPFRSTERTATSTTVTSTELLSVPADFGEMITLTYTPGDGSGFELVERNPTQFFELFPDQVGTGFPNFYCIYNNKFHLAVLPASTYSLTIRYRIASPNIYVHNLDVTYQNNASTLGVAIYLDEDAVGVGEGTLYFVSPTNTDAVIQLASANGHVHTVTVYDADDAATLGVPIYLNENATLDFDKILFASGSGIDCVIATGITRTHKHFIKFVDNLSPSTGTRQIYLDEDVIAKTARVVCKTISTTADTVESVHGIDNILPPFVEQYHDVLYMHALAAGYRYLKEYEIAQAIRKELMEERLPTVMRAENRALDTVAESKPFSVGYRDPWENLRWITSA
jgi:hypothetical protein